MHLLTAPAVPAARRWCLRSAAAGVAAWAVALALLQPGWAPALFLLAPLVIVPLGLALLVADERVRPAGGLWGLLIVLQPPAALLLLLVRERFSQDLIDVVLVRLEQPADLQRGVLAESGDVLARLHRVGL